MTGPESLEARVVRLEQEVTRLRERVAATSSDAAAARVLAGGADRDVAEIREAMRAHTHSLRALGENQLELRQAQQEMQSTLLDHGERSSPVETRLTSLETKVMQGFAEMRSGMGRIVTLLGGAPPA